MRLDYVTAEVVGVPSVINQLSITRFKFIQFLGRLALGRFITIIAEKKSSRQQRIS